MIINTPISLGELLDKISILIIKIENIHDEKKLAIVKKELNLLLKIQDNLSIDKKILDEYLEKLKNVNSELWIIEDKLRDLERNKIFDNGFIELARSVYFTNDKRSEIKLDINKKFGSKIIEVKSYEDY